MSLEQHHERLIISLYSAHVPVSVLLTSRSSCIIYISIINVPWIIVTGLSSESSVFWNFPWHCCQSNSPQHSPGYLQWISLLSDNLLRQALRFWNLLINMHKIGYWVEYQSPIKAVFYHLIWSYICWINGKHV